jgi:hypothetical protein
LVKQKPKIVSLELSVSAEDSRYRSSSLSSGLDSITSSRGSFSSDSLNACGLDAVFSDIPRMSENGLSQPF